MWPQVILIIECSVSGLADMQSIMQGYTINDQDKKAYPTVGQLVMPSVHPFCALIEAGVLPPSSLKLQPES